MTNEPHSDPEQEFPLGVVYTTTLEETTIEDAVLISHRLAEKLQGNNIIETVVRIESDKKINLYDSDK